MPFYLFRWTEETEAHIAQHGITRTEFQEVVMSPSRVEASRSSGYEIAFGETSTGKVIACVYEEFADTIYPSTAFEIDL